MKKINCLILYCLVLVLFIMPNTVFAAELREGNAHCDVSGISAEQWIFQGWREATSGESKDIVGSELFKDYNNGATFKRCCRKGGGDALKFYCDEYKFNTASEEGQSDAEDPGICKNMDTNESSAIQCEGKDLSGYSFDFTCRDIDSDSDPSSGEVGDTTITCCQITKSSYQNNGISQYACTYYTNNQVIEEGYQTEADKAKEQEKEEEREELDDITGDTEANCDAIFDPEARALIERLFQIVCIAVPILLIVLGSVDFGNAVLSSDKEALQKAVKRFTTRCIVAVAIFFLPMLVDLIFHFPGMDIIEGIVFCDV